MTTGTVTQSTCASECTVTVVVEPVPLSQEQLDDLSVMFGCFVLAAIVIYFGRQLLRLFETSPSED